MILHILLSSMFDMYTLPFSTQIGTYLLRMNNNEDLHIR